MARGNNRQKIFIEPGDEGDFFRVLAESKELYPFELFSYCLMPNHFHVLLRVGDVSLSRIMQRVLTTYAHLINKRSERVGHLFQGRFRSVPCCTDAQLLETLRYIHLNPVRSKLAGRVEEWDWSSHRDYAGTREGGLVDKGFLLSMFHQDAALAQEAYLRFVGQGSAFDPGAGGDSKAPEDVDGSAARPASKEVEDVAIVCCKQGGVSMDELIGAGRRRAVVSARRFFIRRAVRAGISVASLSRFLGMSGVAIRRLAKPSPDAWVPMRE